MSTMYKTAAILPDTARLHAHHLMENGSGDDFAVLFTLAGVLIRGFTTSRR